MRKDLGVTCQLEYFIEREMLAGETSRYNFIVEITVIREVTKLGRLDLSEVASYIARPFKLTNYKFCSRQLL